MPPLLDEIDGYQDDEHDAQGGHHDQTDAFDEVALVEPVSLAKQRVVVSQLIIIRHLVVTLLHPLLSAERQIRNRSGELLHRAMLHVQTFGYPKRMRDFTCCIVQIEHRDATPFIPVCRGFVVLMQLDKNGRTERRTPAVEHTQAIQQGRYEEVMLFERKINHYYDY